MSITNPKRGGPKGFRLYPTPNGRCITGCGRFYKPGSGSQGRCPACSRRAQRAAQRLESPMTEQAIRDLMRTLSQATPVADDGADPEQRRLARETAYAISGRIADYYRPRQTDRSLPAVDRDAARLTVRLMEKNLARYAPTTALEVP